MTLHGKGTVLVVDDEFAIAETLRDLLEGEGYRVLVAGNGQEGLARLAEERPDLVLTDVMMPGLGGLEMLQAMRADPERRDIPVIIMSSAPRTAAIKATQDAREFATFLRKPFDLTALLTLIEALIGPKTGP